VPRATTFGTFSDEFSTATADVEIGVVTPPVGPKLKLLASPSMTPSRSFVLDRSLRRFDRRS
jgi:hypothetical protein